MDTCSLKNILQEICPTKGFYEVEFDEGGPFVWTKPRFNAQRLSKARFFAATLCFYGDEGKLIVRSEEGQETSIDLYRGWHTYPLDLSELHGENVEFELHNTIEVEGDDRELGVMIRKLIEIDDFETFTRLRGTLRNRVINHTEYTTGHSTLRSYPPKLRIDLENRCNVKPPCVYCEWEWIKHLEGQTDYRFIRDTFSQLGLFFAMAEEVVDCSYGEPLLNPNLQVLINEVCRGGREFAMTSNGQLLDAQNRRKILGKPMLLNVSIDSSTAGGYRLYRNNTFDVVIKNLRALCREKKQYNDCPRVFASFIVMRSNVDDLLPFIRLMRDAGVDGIRLRCLFREPRTKRSLTSRNGFVFIYDREILDDDSFAEAVRTARPVAKDCGLSLVSELDFVRNNGSKGVPLCREPWETLYVLTRGIYGCCFSRKPLVNWSQRGQRSLEEFLKETWNGSTYQALRSALAERRLPKSCLDSPNCAIVRKVLDEGSSPIKGGAYVG